MRGGGWILLGRASGKQGFRLSVGRAVECVICETNLGSGFVFENFGNACSSSTEVSVDKPACGSECTDCRADRGGFGTVLPGSNDELCANLTVADKTSDWNRMPVSEVRRRTICRFRHLPPAKCDLVRCGIDIPDAGFPGFIGLYLSRSLPFTR
jgi:hypothetical protein